MNKLEIGQEAPDFTAIDVRGEVVKLSAYTGGYVLLAFLRYAGCPWCNLAVHRLALESKLLAENDCQVIAFVQSSKENIIHNIYDRHAVLPSFPIIADPDKSIYTEYGVGSSFKTLSNAINDIPFWVHAVKKHGFSQGTVDGNLFLAPGMFLVRAKDRVVEQAFYGKNFFEHGTFTPIYETLIYEKA